MPQSFFRGWWWRLAVGGSPRAKKPKVSKPITKWARLWFEALEERRLFSGNVWLPQRLAPLDGLAGNNQTDVLFRPTTTNLDPGQGLNSATLTLAGSFTLTDTGSYSLTLKESGPTGTQCFTFTESGTSTFSLTEHGNVSSSGFSNTSFVLTQTVALSWTFVKTDGSGHTVSSQSGTNTFTLQTSAGSPTDPFFWTGFDWYGPTQQVSSLNTLGLASLTASSFSVSQNGGESFTFQQSNGSVTVKGNGTTQLADLSETGQQSYASTTSESFTATNQGNDTYSLSELGTYGNNSYSFSNVTYNETASSNTVSLTETVVQSQSGTATTSGSQSFSANQHSLGNNSNNSFQLTGLSTASYGESAAGTYSLAQSGKYGSGSFSLGSLSYSNRGTGSYTLSQPATETQTGTHTGGSQFAGTDSFSVGGTAAGANTVNESAQYTQTANSTLTEASGGNFTVTEQGGYGNGSFSLSSFNLTESIAGRSTFTQLNTVSESGTATVTQTGTGNDSYALGYAGANTVSAADNKGYTQTLVYTFTITATNSFTENGNSSYTLTEVGKSQAGSYSLASYLFSPGWGGTYTASTSVTETDSGSGNATGQINGNNANTANYGGNSASGLGNHTTISSSSFTFSDTHTFSLTVSGGFSQSSYQAGTYGSGSFAFGSTSYSASANLSWSLTGGDSSTDSGTDTTTATSNGSSSGTSSYGGGNFNGLGNGTYSDTTTDHYTDNATDHYGQNGSENLSIAQQGTYGGYSVAFGSAIFQFSGSSSGSYQDAYTSTFAGTRTESFTSTSNQNGTGTYGLTAAGGNSGTTRSVQETFTLSGTHAGTDSVTGSGGWSVYEGGSFGTGSWALSSVAFQDNSSSNFANQVTDQVSSTGNDSFTITGSSNGNATTVYGGGSVNGLGTTTTNSKGSDNFTDNSLSTFVSSGSNSGSEAEQGTFGGLSFAFSSFVAQSSQNSSDTLTSADTYAASGSKNDTLTLQTLDHGGGVYAAANGSGVQSSTQTTTEQFSTTDNSASSQTITDSDTSSSYQAGIASGGSYSLTSLSYSETYSGQIAFSGSDTHTDSGSQTKTGTAGGNGTNAVNGNLANESFNSSDTITGSASDTNTDSYTGGGGQNWSLQQQGTYANFSAALGTLSYQASGSSTKTRTDTTRKQFSGTSSESRTSGESFTDNNNFGVLTNGGPGNVSQSRNINATVNNSASGSDTVSSSTSWSLYLAGSEAFGSYSLSSVASFDGASASWSSTASASGTMAAMQTRTATGTVISNNTFANAGAVGSQAMGGNVTVTSNQCVTGTDTTTSVETITDNGAAAWSFSEQGTYGGWSYSLGSVVYQGTQGSSGTVQRTTSDNFAGSFSVGATLNQQMNNSGSQGQGSANSQNTVSNSGNLVITDLDSGSANSTDTGSGTVTWYEAGSESGGSFAFASLTNTISTNDSATVHGTTSSIETTTLTGSVAGNQSSSNTGSYQSNTIYRQTANGNSANANFQVVTNQQGSFTNSTSHSYTRTDQGSSANGSAALSSYTLQTSDSSSSSAQQTSTVSETLTASGTGSSSSNATWNSVEQGSIGNQCFTSVTIVYQINSSGSNNFSGTVTASDTVTANQASSFSESRTEQGSFGGGSWALSSMTYSASGSSSATSQSNDSRTTTDTLTAGVTQTGSMHGPEINDGYSYQQSRTFSGQDTLTSTRSITQQQNDTYSLYEAGTFGGDSYSLSSFNLQDSENDSISQSGNSTQSSVQNGTYTAVETEGNQLTYNTVGTFSNVVNESNPFTGTSADSYNLSEQGTFGGGSCALTAYALSLQQSGTASASFSGSSNESVSGTNSVSGTSGAFTGRETATFGGNQTSSTSASLTQQGSYANGTFTLSAVNYSSSGSDSFGSNDSSNGAWSGAYAGNDTSSDQASANDCYSMGGSGNFISGSFSLTSYSYQGQSAGSYSHNLSEAQTFNGQARSGSRGESGQESNTLYQTGTQPAGMMYTNGSYSYQASGSSSASDQANGPGLSMGDTWTQQHATQQTLSGVQTSTSASTYTHQDSGGSGTLSNSESATPTAPAPGPLLQFVAPDGTLVPVAGAAQLAQAAPDGSMAPVPAAPSLQGISNAGQWMGATQLLGGQGVSQASGQMNWQVNGLPVSSTIVNAADWLNGAISDWSYNMGLTSFYDNHFASGGPLMSGALKPLPELPPVQPFAVQAWNAVQPLLQLLGPWSGGRARMVEARLEGLLGVQKPHQADRPPTTGDSLVDWVDGMLYNGSGPLTVGSAQLYGGGAVGVSAQFALSQSSFWVEQGIGIVAGMWMSLGGPEFEAAWGEGEESLLGDVLTEMGTEEAVGGAAEAAVADTLVEEEEAELVADEVVTEAVLGDEEAEAVSAEAVQEEEGIQACLSPSKQCFAAGTPLLTPLGDQLIERLRVGDSVLARDENHPAGPVEAKAVQQVFARQARLLHVHVGGQVIRTTAEHPFFVYNRGWVVAGELQAGEELLGHDDRRTAVEEVFDTGEFETVYNLRVADYHTYFVGSRAWGFSAWAHNQICDTFTTSLEEEMAAENEGWTNAAKNGTLEEEVDFGPGKPGPKTDVNAPHNATIREEAGRLEAEGNTILAGGGRRPERVIQTPGGLKETRRPDILYQTPSGELRGVNVGRVMEDGSPVSREVEALQDLNGPGRLPTVFVPYFP
jgi:hypothetical protein